MGEKWLLTPFEGQDTLSVPKRAERKGLYKTGPDHYIRAHAVGPGILSNTTVRPSNCISLMFV
jgi:hypothetical protein